LRSAYDPEKHQKNLIGGRGGSRGGGGGGQGGISKAQEKGVRIKGHVRENGLAEKKKVRATYGLGKYS